LNHHKIFNYFPRWAGILEREYAWATFVGAKIHHSFAIEYQKGETDRYIQSNYPDINEEYFEWIDLLDSVHNSRQKFIMVELGAGYGRWIVNAAKVFEIANIPIPYLMIGVEAAETHFKWMKEHIVNNNLPFKNFRLIQAAVGEKNGRCLFPMGIPNTSYGQSIIKKNDNISVFRACIKKVRNSFLQDPSTSLEIDMNKHVKVFTLEKILDGIDKIDLIDMDIQGTAFEVLNAAKDIINKKVKKIHIGTHSIKIEEELRVLFSSLGWNKIWDFQINSKSDTEWGTIKFSDGVQSWENPYLN